MLLNSCTIVLIIIIGICLIFNSYEYEYEGMVNIPNINKPIKFNRNINCKYMMGSTMKKMLKKHNIKETKKEDWMIYIPCTYNHINKEIADVHPTNNDQRVFIINNADELSAKHLIWTNLVKTYGRDIATRLMPTTYLLRDKDDMILFKKEYNKDKIYILKKNIQRQKGLKITSNKNEIMNGKKDGYIVVQELLQDPYIINGRKINMRFYLLVIHQDKEVDSYVYNDGFMYYTRDKFKKNSIEDGPNITTGYIDRKVYKENPLTHDDFRKYLDVKINIKLSTIVFKEIYNMLSLAINSIPFTPSENLKDNITFQLFGADIALNDKLHPQLIEINKGPDLGAKGLRDKKVKYGMVQDALKILKIIPQTGDNGFIKINE